MNAKVAMIYLKDVRSETGRACDRLVKWSWATHLWYYLDTGCVIFRWNLVVED